jgi:hypothetical protein
MTRCALFDECGYFQEPVMQAEPDLAARQRSKFCDGAYQTCARFAVARVLGVDEVPADLDPLQRERAVLILGAAG